MAIIRGMDVSAFQKVDFTKARAAIEFVIVKCTEGDHTTSDDWRGHWDNAGRAGLIRGSYHLAHPDYNAARDEANHYLTHLRAAGWRSGRDLPPVLDLEPDGVRAIGSRSRISAWAAEFMEHVDAQLGLDEPWLRTGFYVGDSIAHLVDIATLNRGRWFWRGGFGSTWPATVPEGCAIFQRVGSPSLVPGVISRSLDIDVVRSEDLRRLAPHHFPAVSEDDMPLTDADAAKIAEAVWDHGISIGPSGMKIGGYTRKTYKARELQVGPDAYGRDIRRTLADVLDGLGKLAGPMPDAEREALATAIAGKVDSLRVVLDHDEPEEGTDA